MAALAGAALFAWSIRAAGAAAVVDGIKRIGPGIAVVILLGGMRGLVRAAAWRLCFAAGHRPDLATMFAAFLAGDALGNITPFGLLISEPSKVVLLRKRIDPPASIAALTIENLFYSAAVAGMLVAGTIALTAFAVPQPIRIASAVVLTAAVALGGGLWIAVTRGRTIGGAFASLLAARTRNRHVEHWLPRVRETGERIAEFAARAPGAVLPIIAFEASYHVLAVVEIWFALALITGSPPALLTAFVLEYVNRVITVGFQFVPMWLGVDEAGTSAATTVLGLGPAAGVSLALARKARVAVWTAIGIAFGVRFSGSRVHRFSGSRET